MKHLLAMMIICITLPACTSGHKKTNTADSVKTAVAVSNTGPFDLAKLTLKEKDAPGMIAGRNVKPEPVSDNEQTLFGYTILKSSSSEVLRFGGEDLSGVNGIKKNHVLFHYNDKTKALGFYEIKIYTQKQADVLLKELQKMGKPEFEKIGVSNGAFEVDVNGNAVESGKEEKQTYRVWENKKNGLTYFLSEVGTGKNLEAVLTALDKSAPHAKDWISFRSLDWYKK